MFSHLSFASTTHRSHGSCEEQREAIERFGADAEINSMLRCAMKVPCHPFNRLVDNWSDAN
jgi:hypothetical protein